MPKACPWHDDARRRVARLKPAPGPGLQRPRQAIARSPARAHFRFAPAAHRARSIAQAPEETPHAPCPPRLGPAPSEDLVQNLATRTATETPDETIDRLDALAQENRRIHEALCFNLNP